MTKSPGVYVCEERVGQGLKQKHILDPYRLRAWKGDVGGESPGEVEGEPDPARETVLVGEGTESDGEGFELIGGGVGHGSVAGVTDIGI